MYIQKVPHAKRKKANQRLQKRIEKTKKILITKERTKEHTALSPKVSPSTLD